MFFCQKCRYIYDISKDLKNVQIGGSINNALTVIFDKVDQPELLQKADLENVTFKDLSTDERFEHLPKKKNQKLIARIKQLDKSFFQTESNIAYDKSAYFVCKYCKHYQLIEPGTLIYSKNYGLTASEQVDYQYAAFDPTLTQTKNYICKNVDCATHNEPQLRAAALTKNSKDQIVYICKVCLVDWVHAG